MKRVALLLTVLLCLGSSSEDSSASRRGPTARGATARHSQRVRHPGGDQSARAAGCWLKRAGGLHLEARRTSGSAGWRRPCRAHVVQRFGCVRSPRLLADGRPVLRRPRTLRGDSRATRAAAVTPGSARIVLRPRSNSGRPDHLWRPICDDSGVRKQDPGLRRQGLVRDSVTQMCTLLGWVVHHIRRSSLSSDVPAGADG